MRYGAREVVIDSAGNAKYKETDRRGFVASGNVVVVNLDPNVGMGGTRRIACIDPVNAAPISEFAMVDGISFSLEALLMSQRGN